jgi:hypothetical protein
MLSADSAFAAPASLDRALGLRAASIAARPAAPAAENAGSSARLLGVAAAAAAVASTSRKSARVPRRALPAAVAAGDKLAVPVPEPAAKEAPAPPPPFDPAREIGATAPLGFFDPLGFCKVGDYETFHKLRAAEIKHGRVAMMAAFGTVFQHFVRFPWAEKVPAGLKALTDPVGLSTFPFLLAVIGFTEIIYWRDDDLNKEPGNFGDPANWSELLGDLGGYTEENRNKEINNGRFAMFAIIGIMVAELATGRDGIQQFGL